MPDAPARTAHAILTFVADYPGTFGRHRAARVIVGNAGEDDIDRAPDLPVGGALPDARAADVLRAIDALIEQGAICKTFGDRPRLCLTRTGWGYVAALELLTTMEGVTA